jgi:hypothetical protein
MPFYEYGLSFEKGHLFAEIEGKKFVLDTGSPMSMAASPGLGFRGQELRLPGNVMGLTPAQLSEFIGTEVHGLLGTDVLNEGDLLFDFERGKLVVPDRPLPLVGEAIPFKPVMGVPLVEASVDGQAYGFFFDTGARISYFQDEDVLAKGSKIGTDEDFYPGFGCFETETYRLEVKLVSRAFSLVTGTLPTMLGLSLSMADADGILGNEVLQGLKSMAYMPGRSRIVME